ncbi:M20/M25/M40 family metallo-hydrolase [Chloroflexi bacterium TSY]|nr:M20/M25/M40 family metallo-hydrolase [Chloroflexi bacterium TSY]
MTEQRERTDSTLLSKVLMEIENRREQQIALRRKLHMHPELAGQEQQTARIIVDCLNDLDLERQTNIAGHGVVGTLHGEQPGPIVAYYTPMDAPLVPQLARQTEEGEHQEQIASVRHVGGHDVYMAVALGLATALSAVRDQLPGTVRFIFQPAEMPRDGAYAMLDAGVLDEPTPQAIFALSAAPLPVGQFMVGPGVGLPGRERFDITVQAKHDLTSVADTVRQALKKLSTLPPFGGVDPQTIFDWLMMENGPLQSFINVRSDPPESGMNPEQCTIRGRVKASDEDAFAQARDQIRQTLAEFTTDDVQIDLKFLNPRLPNLRSDSQLTQAVIPALEAVVGQENVLIQRASFPHGGAGFALFAERVPSVMHFLGASNPEKGVVSLPFTANFDIDEEAITIGTKAMASVIINSLGGYDTTKCTKESD